MSHMKLMELMDELPMTVQVKGAHRKFTSKRLIISTNQDPKKWYPKLENTIDGKEPLQRRIQDFAKIYTYTGRYGREDDPQVITEETDMSNWTFAEPDQVNFGH